MSEKARPDSAKWDASFLQRPFWARDVNDDDRDETESSCDFLKLSSITQECDLHLSSSGIPALPDSYSFTFFTDSSRDLVSSLKFSQGYVQILISGNTLSLLFIEC